MSRGCSLASNHFLSTNLFWLLSSTSVGLLFSTLSARCRLMSSYASCSTKEQRRRSRSVVIPHDPLQAHEHKKRRCTRARDEPRPVGLDREAAAAAAAPAGPFPCASAQGKETRGGVGSS